ncbi:MAG: hypothetical protein PVF98_14360 [Desulfobacterales bacterium]
MFKYTSIHTGVCPHGKWLMCFLLVLGGLSIVGLGCGKKAPPVPPKRPSPPMVQDLRHTIQGDRIELSWTLPAASDGRAAEIKVLRATQSEEEIGCEGCPLRFEVAAEIPIHHKAFGKSEPRTLYFTEAIDPGYRYTYKVIVLDEYGIRSQDSNIVKFDH